MDGIGDALIVAAGTVVAAGIGLVSVIVKHRLRRTQKGPPESASSAEEGELQDSVVANPVWEKRRDAVRDHLTTIATLRALARDDVWEVRKAVAGCLRVPPDVLEALSRDAVWEVRLTAAQNPHIPDGVLRSLLRDEVWEVHEASEKAMRRR